MRREITRARRAEAVPADRAQLFAALADPAGVTAHRPGALERVALLLEDWRHPRRGLAETERRMIGCWTSSG